MLGDIVLFTYDELISVITLMSEEYKNNITCNGISCAAYKYNHRYLRLYEGIPLRGTPSNNACTRARVDPQFARGKTREYVLLEVALHDIAIRKIRFGLPKSGNTKVCHANGSST